MFEELGALSAGLMFIAVGIWAKVNPTSFLETFPTDVSERYDELFLRFFPPLAVVAGLMGTTLAVYLLVSG